MINPRVSLGRLVARVIVACQWWHCYYGVILRITTNYNYGIVNPEYNKSGINQSDVDWDWAHSAVKDSAPHVSHVLL